MPSNLVDALPIPLFNSQMSPTKYASFGSVRFRLYVSLNWGTISFTNTGLKPACSSPKERPPQPANKSINDNFRLAILLLLFFVEVVGVNAFDFVGFLFAYPDIVFYHIPGKLLAVNQDNAFAGFLDKGFCLFAE